MTPVTARQFKAAVRRDRKSAAELMVQKLSVIAPPEDLSGPIRFCITTSGIDREGDTIAIDGWELQHYQRNPVVLWGHDLSQPPIGRAAKLFRDGDALKADVEFVPADVPVWGLRAEGVRQLCASGFLFATSVGFRPIEWAEAEDKSRDNGGWFPPIDFRRQELMEFSIVAIPCNPDALIEHEPRADAFGSAADPAAAAALVEAQAAAFNLRRQRQMRERLARLFA